MSSSPWLWVDLVDYIPTHIYGDCTGKALETTDLYGGPRLLEALAEINSFEITDHYLVIGRSNPKFLKSSHYFISRTIQFINGLNHGELSIRINRLIFR